LSPLSRGKYTQRPLSVEVCIVPVCIPDTLEPGALGRVEVFGVFDSAITAFTPSVKVAFVVAFVVASVVAGTVVHGSD
jgi:small neutral amino acid transporter SnatA (MarC family)